MPPWLRCLRTERTTKLMKPNFALNLSPEGISLLQRMEKGWVQLGEVSLASETLAADLAALKAKGEEHAGGPLLSKLVIPSSQVLYTEFETRSKRIDDHLNEIAEHLDGKTPYDVNELVWDFRHVGSKLQVAVTAAETLEEAETFASAYGFNPVTIVATPDQTYFPGEAFFGPTKEAQTYIGSVAVEPDTKHIQSQSQNQNLSPRRLLQRSAQPNQHLSRNLFSSQTAAQRQRLNHAPYQPAHPFNLNNRGSRWSRAPLSLLSPPSPNAAYPPCPRSNCLRQSFRQNA